ncbi:MAG: hypothetical protein U0168_23160 [Nannocystaceae bacterium]
MKTLLLTTLCALSLSACKVAPPTPPYLSSEELAIVVVRPSQDLALALAQTCEPVGALTSPTEGHLRQRAVAKGANVAEVLYDGGGSTAVLHRCPAGFDVLSGGAESFDAATRGSYTTATTQTVTVH